MDDLVKPEDSLFIEISQADSPLVVLFWHVGKRINTEIVQQKRAE